MTVVVGLGERMMGGQWLLLIGRAIVWIEQLLSILLLNISWSLYFPRSFGEILDDNVNIYLQLFIVIILDTIEED